MLEQAADRMSPDTSARLWLGLSLLDLGFADRALPHLIKAQSKDPLVPIYNGYLGLAHATLGRFQEGGRFSLRAVELGEQAFWVCVIALEPANNGDPATASQLLATAQPMVTATDHEFLAGMRAALEDASKQATFLAAHEAGAQQGRSLSMLAALMFRDRDMLFSRDGPRAAYEFMTSSAWLPSLTWVREDPQFYRLMQQRGIVGFWEMHGFPPGCRTVDDPAGRRLDCGGEGP